MGTSALSIYLIHRSFNQRPVFIHAAYLENYSVAQQQDHGCGLKMRSGYKFIRLHKIKQYSRIGQPHHPFSLQCANVCFHAFTYTSNNANEEQFCCYCV